MKMINGEIVCDDDNLVPGLNDRVADILAAGADALCPNRGSLSVHPHHHKLAVTLASRL